MDLHTKPRDDGRPSLLTPERSALIVEAVAAGATLQEAAAQAGISIRTLEVWMTKGNRRRAGDRNGGYRAFVVELNKASRRATRMKAAERRQREEEARAARTDAHRTERVAVEDLRHTVALLRKAVSRSPVARPGNEGYEAFQAELDRMLARANTDEALKDFVRNVARHEAEQRDILRQAVQRTRHHLPLS
jgi:hypothetical protein